MNKIKYRLSHIHLKVADTKKAVEELRNLGFTVEFGHKGNVSPNAFIWFNDHAFIEIYSVTGPAKLAAPFMKMGYGKVMGDRYGFWSKAPEGFTDFAIEPVDPNTAAISNLDSVREKLIADGFEVSKKMIGSRRTPRDETVEYGFCGINPNGLPFLVTAYSIKQIPDSISHRNGIDTIYRMEVSCCESDMKAMKRLVGDDPKVIITQGNKTGITKVIFASKEEEFIPPKLQGVYGMNVEFVKV